MARKKSPTITDAELRLMNVLWDRGPSTVGDVAEALPRKLGLAYSTVLTTLRILERKGYIRHERNGRAFVYRPVVDRGQVRRSAVKYVVSRFFQDSPELLVLNVLEHEKLDPGELKRLRELIERGE
jgi:predicted transcriptional regulator